jgi:anti-sigma B factor antagonist
VPNDEPTRFSVETTADGTGTHTLTISGEVDTFTSAGLRDALNEAIGGGSTDIIIDMSAMEFIDSTGLGVLVGALKRLRERDGTVTLRKPRPAALQVLSIVGLTSQFLIEE